MRLPHPHNCAEQHVELRADLAGSESEFGEEAWISLMGRKGPVHEPKLVVVLDRGRADNNIAEHEVAGEAAGRSRADQGMTSSGNLAAGHSFR